MGQEGKPIRFYSLLELWSMMCVINLFPPWEKGQPSVPLNQIVTRCVLLEEGVVYFLNELIPLAEGIIWRRGKLWALSLQHSQQLRDEWPGLVQGSRWGSNSTYSTFVCCQQNSLFLQETTPPPFQLVLVGLTLLFHSYSSVQSTWNRLPQIGL